MIQNHHLPILPISKLGLVVSGCVLVISCGLMASRPVQAQEQPEYRLGPEDVVQIQVLNRLDLSGTRTVGVDGKLLDTYLDEIQASGRTEADLSAEFTRRYRILFPGVSQVQVKVVEYNSRKIIVTGEVRRPDTYGYRDIPQLWEVVVKDALGLTPAADPVHVQIIRNEPVEGEPRILTVDLSPLLADSVPDSLPNLRPGDIINVPSLIADAPAGATFQVLGSVRNPGVYSLRRAETLAEALAISGGPLAGANLREVRLTRISPDGLVAYRLDLEGLLYEGKVDADLKLQGGDTVTVPIKRFGAGTAGRTLVLLVPLVTSIASLILIIDRGSR